MKSGIQLITEERVRQVAEEGWTHEHDDKHDRAELSGAAACYVIANVKGYIHKPEFGLWPWDLESWKPGNDPIKRLVKAGALIAAEIDRIQRLTIFTAENHDRCN